MFSIIKDCTENISCRCLWFYWNNQGENALVTLTCQLRSIAHNDARAWSRAIYNVYANSNTLLITTTTKTISIEHFSLKMYYMNSFTLYNQTCLLRPVRPRNGTYKSVRQYIQVTWMTKFTDSLICVPVLWKLNSALK